jgi:hypothetical protein
MNVVFNCDYAGMAVARYIGEGEQIAPGHTLFALVASCRRGRRYFRVFLSFVLRSKGIVIKPMGQHVEPVDCFVRRMFVSYWKKGGHNGGYWPRECASAHSSRKVPAQPLQVPPQRPKAPAQRARATDVIPLHPLMLGRWPWLPKTPLVPPLPAFHLHCCAIEGGDAKLVALAGLDRESSYGTAALQVRVPDALPRHRGDPPRPTSRFIRNSFSVQGQRIGNVAAMRWIQTTAHTRLILSVETTKDGNFIVVFTVGETGALAMTHCVLGKREQQPAHPLDLPLTVVEKDHQVLRVCEVLHPSGFAVDPVMYNNRGIRFMTGEEVELACLHAIPWLGGVCAVTRSSLYRVAPPLSPQQKPVVDEECRLDDGVEFVGPMCLDKAGGALLLLCRTRDKGMGLVCHDPGDKEAYFACRFPDSQDYKPDHMMGVLESGSVVLCGCDGHLVFARDAKREGMYSQPRALTPWHTGPVIQTTLVCAGRRVRSVLSLNDNGLVSVWGDHPAVAQFRAARTPKY